MSDNTFYDIDGASNFYNEKLKRHAHQNHDLNVPAMVGSKIDERDAHHFISDWASTGEETSCYDDRSSALKSLIGPAIRSITPNKSSRGAYFIHFAL